MNSTIAGSLNARMLFVKVMKIRISTILTITTKLTTRVSYC